MLGGRGQGCRKAEEEEECRRGGGGGGRRWFRRSGVEGRLDEVRRRRRG